MNSNKMKSNAASISIVLVGTLLLMGCASEKTPVYKPITLTITKAVASSIEVDLIPVSSADQQNWSSYPPDKYWQPGDPQREQEKSKKTLYLNKDEPVVIASTDAVWQDWIHNRGAAYVLIMAHLDPNALKTNPDAARHFLPLDEKAWPKERAVQVQVTDTRVSVLTPMKEKR